MALRQSRRTISYNRALYDLIHEAAAAEGKSASQWASELIAAKLKRLGYKPPVMHFDGPPARGRTAGHATVAPVQGGGWQAALAKLKRDWGMT